MSSPHLYAAIENFGGLTAVVTESGRTLTFAELARCADATVAALPGRCLLSIEASNELEPLLAYIGACRAGCPVILTDQETVAKDDRVRTRFAPSFHFSRNHSGWGFTDLRQGNEPKEHELHADLCTLLSTSGSTGNPKLVKLSAHNLAANAVSIAEYLQILPTDRAITTLPFNYSFGLSVINSHLLTGASLSLTNASVLDAAFWAQFARDEVSNFAGVPRTYELLEHSGFLETNHPRLTHFIQAGGRLIPEKVTRFAAYAQRHGARFYVMYGQTEASPRMAYLPPHLVNEYPDCIGVAVPGGRFEIEDPEGRIVATPNTPGILCYHGPNVMMGYALEKADLGKSPELEKLVTGDIALRNEQGLYRIVGRASRFVKIAGLRLSLDDIQETVAGRGVETAVAGDDALIAVALTSDDGNGNVANFLNEKFRLPPGVLEVVRLPQLPRFTSGKLNFPAILNAARTQRDHARSEHLPESERFRAELAAVLGRKSLGDDETFNQAGGDSLNYVEGRLVVEKYRKTVPASWSRVPFAHLASPERTASTDHGNADPIVVARAFAVLLAMTSHCFLQFGVWDFLSEFRIISRAATPTFLVLFGLMLAHAYWNASNPLSLGALYRRCLPNSVILFTAAALVQFCAAIGGKLTFTESLGAAFFLNEGIFGNILTTYSLLFLLTPLLIVGLRRHAGWFTLGILTFAWGIWTIFRDVGVSSYPLSFLFGVDREFGPSVLQGLTLVLFGFSLGTAPGTGRRLNAAVIFLTAAVLLLAYQLGHHGIETTIRGVSNYLRARNHPYYYAYGIVAAAALLGLAFFAARQKALRLDRNIFYALGLNSMLAFTVGNMVLNMIPTTDLPLGWGLVVTCFFITTLAFFTADVSRAKPRVFGPVASGVRGLIGYAQMLIKGPAAVKRA